MKWNGCALNKGISPALTCLCPFTINALQMTFYQPYINLLALMVGFFAAFSVILIILVAGIKFKEIHGRRRRRQVSQTSNHGWNFLGEFSHLIIYTPNSKIYHQTHQNSTFILIIIINKKTSSVLFRVHTWSSILCNI